MTVTYDTCGELKFARDKLKSQEQEQNSRLNLKEKGRGQERTERQR